MATKYTLFILNGFENVSSKEMTYAKAKAKAIDRKNSHSIRNMLAIIIWALNNETISDQNWYFLCDNKTKTVIYGNI